MRAHTETTVNTNQKPVEKRNMKRRKRETCLIRNVCSVIKKNVKKAVKFIS